MVVCVCVCVYWIYRRQQNLDISPRRLISRGQTGDGGSGGGRMDLFCLPRRGSKMVRTGGSGKGSEVRRGNNKCKLMVSMSLVAASICPKMIIYL